MLELLKKIGLPATVAAVIASLVTIVPLLFTIDERYAKEDDLKLMFSKLENQNHELRREIAQNAGFQQAMVGLIQQGRLPQPAAAAQAATRVQPETQPTEPVRMRLSVPRPAPASVEARVTSSSDVPVPVVVAAPLEKPKNWNEISEGLTRQQKRLVD